MKILSDIIYILNWVEFKYIEFEFHFIVFKFKLNWGKVLIDWCKRYLKFTNDYDVAISFFEKIDLKTPFHSSTKQIPIWNCPKMTYEI